MATQDGDNHSVRLIDIANDIAMAGLPTSRGGFQGHEADYLKRFRAAYRHLKWTVEVNHSENESNDLAEFDSSRAAGS